MPDRLREIAREEAEAAIDRFCASVLSWDRNRPDPASHPGDLLEWVKQRRNSMAARVKSRSLLLMGAAGVVCSALASDVWPTIRHGLLWALGGF